MPCNVASKPFDLRRSNFLGKMMEEIQRHCEWVQSVEYFARGFTAVIVRRKLAGVAVI